MLQIQYYLRRMAAAGLIGLLLWALLYPWRRGRRQRKGLCPGPCREWALLLFYMFLSGLLLLVLTPPAGWGSSAHREDGRDGGSLPFPNPCCGQVLFAVAVPTVVDRLIQQAVTQELTPLFEPQFSENSYGFRPGRSQHDALRACKKNVEEGYVYVVSMDLEKFFDTVNHSKLIEVLSRTIEDGRVVSLIHKYLNAGVLQNGFFEKREEGVPQGGPLSPLCGNVMLNELDKELERRGHRFVRYADDALIFCKSRKSAERTLANIIPFIEGKLFLKVNRAKTTVTHVSKIKYLGYAFYRNKGKCRFRVHPKTIRKMKDRIREITGRNKGWSNDYRRRKLAEYVRGWINYYRLADMKGLMTETDEWLRRRIRAMYWKQWKKVKTRYRNLRALKLEEWQVHQIANSRKGYWRTAQMLSVALTNKIIARLGYISMLDYYLKVA